MPFVSCNHAMFYKNITLLLSDKLNLTHDLVGFEIIPELPLFCLSAGPLYLSSVNYPLLSFQCYPNRKHQMSSYALKYSPFL